MALAPGLYGRAAGGQRALLQKPSGLCTFISHKERDKAVLGLLSTGAAGIICS